MKVLVECINGLIDDYKFLGKSNEEIENMFKDMLRIKAIDVDDYENVMKKLYGED